LLINVTTKDIYTKRKITARIVVRRCLFYLSLSGEITALEIGAVYLNTNRDEPETHNKYSLYL